MSIYRIYPQKSNTIAGSYFSNINSGQNAVTDLWYGGGGTDTAPDKRNSYSRFLLYFDLNEFKEKLKEKEINESLIKSYTLNLKNSKPRDIVLENDYEYDVLFKNIATSFDLISFPINKYWDEGRGYDLIKELYITKQNNNQIVYGTSNWNYCTNATTWDEPGIYTNPTASTNLISTQHFDIGDEDIKMDITDIVKSWINNDLENNGIAISYRRDYELLSTNTRYISSFFTEKTNSAFKPYIQVEYNQVIHDDRKQISNNRMSNLFLYTFSGHNYTNINLSSVTVDIKNASNEIIYSSITPIQLSKGIYYVTVLMTGTTPGDIYKDIWKNISFDKYDVQNIEQSFQIQNNYYENIPSINEYVLQTYGIENGTNIYQNEKIRVYCDLRVNYSNNEPKTSYSIEYKIMLNNQICIIPWTEVNQAVIKNNKLNYFDFDTSWLLHNQTYQIMFRISEMGTNRIMPEKINIKVLKEFN